MKVIPFEEKYRQDFISFNADWIVSNFECLEEHDKETFEKIDEEIEAGAMIFFAVENDIALATCMASPMEGETWEICKLASNKNIPHKGAGSAVFEEAMKWALCHGAKRLFILSNSKLKPALHIYKKYGFQEIKLQNYAYDRGDIAFEYKIDAAENSKERNQKKNPWEEIPLEEYESHMKLDSVMQLQTMNEMMKDQLNAYPVSSAIIFGVAGGNGLEHVQKEKFEKIYGVDVNASYLQETARRYPALNGILECLCIDLRKETAQLPKADLVIANLLLEYIGYECFQKAMRQANPQFASCIIQINTQENWVSDSPYLHIFDGLERIHCQLDEQTLERSMAEIGYSKIKTLERALPNGKKLVQMDVKRNTL